MPLISVVHSGSVADNCLVRNDWICPLYLQTRSEILLEALREHLLILVLSLAIGLLVGFPLALLARRTPWLKSLVLGAATIVYTVPSLALFVLVLPYTGLTVTTVVLALGLYSLTIIVRGVVAGLEGVPSSVEDAARGVGYGPRRLLWQVQVPLALPSLIASLRVAGVSTVALTTVGAVVAHGGLGNLLFDALSTRFFAQVLTASVLTVLLAFAVDLLLLGLQRALTPWRRGVAA
ncbi:ABC transporter permease [uncultured Pseudokineococcus sp.]|uniref:ABC transporter permease n=1 Tax=uncultured Pseudokineococcus sp. TaxID=1642928 RepID=UPI00260AC3F3|nr:ABC transporter permease [uncultured Pseudokineococcus sp.]